MKYSKLASMYLLGGKWKNGSGKRKKEISLYKTVNLLQNVNNFVKMKFCCFRNQFSSKICFNDSCF